MARAFFHRRAGLGVGHLQPEEKAWSLTTRLSRMRTASDTDSPMAASAFAGLRLDFVVHPDVQHRGMSHDRILRLRNCVSRLRYGQVDALTMPGGVRCLTSVSPGDPTLLFRLSYLAASDGQQSVDAGLPAESANESEHPSD